MRPEKGRGGRWGGDAARLLALGLAALAAACSTPESPESKTASVAYYDLVGHFAEADAVAGAAGAPHGDAARGLLFVPVGSRLVYPLPLAPRSALRLEGVTVRGGARLEVSLETDARGVEALARYERSAPAVVLPLGEEGGAARLVLQARSDSGQGAILLRRAELWAASDAPARAPAASPRRPPQRPNILVYLIDTLRRDRLGCYGYPRPITPRLDAFAAEAALFENAFAQASWTKPAVASLFTSRWPPAHGAVGWKHRLPESAETVAESLRAGGYRTAAFVTNPNVIAEFGFDQGFDDFVRRLKIPSTEVNDLVLRWLDRPRPRAPLFLYVHTMDPHAPYTPPEPYRGRFAPDADRMPSWAPAWKWPREALPYLSALYDAEIAENDESFGLLVEALAARGLWEDLAVVVVSDHGEEFREHGRWRHGNNLHAETLNVPLLVKLPGERRGRRVAEPVSQVDLAPTLLDLAGLPAPAAFEGRSLLALARGESAGGRAPAVRSHLRLGRNPEQVSLVEDEWKLIETLGEAEPSTSVLFRWRDDPGEARDLAAERPVTAGVFAALLTAAWRGASAGPAAPEAAVDAELERTLRALGYLQ